MFPGCLMSIPGPSMLDMLHENGKKLYTVPLNHT